MNYHDFSRTNGMPRKRSTFGLPFRHKFTLNAGALYPFYCEEVLPGDTFQNKTSFIIRNLQNMVHPVVDDAYIDFFWFFVPHRIVWAKWEQFCGIAEPSEYVANTVLALPTISDGSTGGNNVYPGSVLEGLGVPAGVLIPQNGTSGEQINVLAIGGFIRIWNDWFRDENLQNSDATADLIYNAASGAQVVIPPGYYVNVAGSTFVTSVNKYHDVFTSALPAPQKGAAVELPLGEFAPVVGAGGTVLDLHESGTLLFGYKPGNLDPTVLADQHTLRTQNGKFSAVSQVNEDSNLVELTHNNLVADLSKATAATVNMLRQAIALQIYFEKLALGGSRYTELLKAMFGVSPSDGRLQRPEYLGGSHQRLNTQQVATTAGTGTPGTSSPTTTGALGAYSVTTKSSRDFVKSFDEFGYLFGLVSIRVKHTYAQGMKKHLMKSNRFDFYWPQFDRMGEVPVSVKEIYAAGSGTFGFQEANYEYRHTPDRCTGLINPHLSGYADFAAWTYTDNYAAAPTLSGSWIREDKTRVDQTLAGNANYPQFLVDVYCDMKATRPMSLNSVPSSFGM